jgi:hypothetical protein
MAHAACLSAALPYVRLPSGIIDFQGEIFSPAGSSLSFLKSSVLFYCEQTG